MGPLVSIGVAVYNVREYLCACLGSVCKQASEEIEILLVDDGSSDGSGEVCDAYAGQSPFVRAIHFPETGAFAKCAIPFSGRLRAGGCSLSMETTNCRIGFRRSHGLCQSTFMTLSSSATPDTNMGNPNPFPAGKIASWTFPKRYWKPIASPARPAPLASCRTHASGRCAIPLFGQRPTGGIFCWNSSCGFRSANRNPRTSYSTPWFTTPAGPPHIFPQ